jgi:hypothetical protein
MKSPLKPLSKSLKVLGFLLGNVINMKKFEDSEGIIFEKTRFLFFKFLILLSPMTIAASLQLGYVFMYNIK